MSKTSDEIPEFSVVMPCLNEAETVGTCIRKARAFFKKNEICAEIILADNGSTDGSQAIAEDEGARVIPIAPKGYGSALKGGIKAAGGRYIIMGDADDTYDFSGLLPFVKKLRQGYDLVMGNRFRGGIAPGAMPILHKYLGNPVLSWIGRTFFVSELGDFYCGLRGFSRAAYEAINPVSTGMEFALELVAKSEMLGLKITEVPTTLSISARTRKPHLKTWTDGWRSLKFFLIWSPRWLFFTPALVLSALATVSCLAFLLQPLFLSYRSSITGTMLAMFLFFVLSYQCFIFGVLSKTVATRVGMHPKLPNNPIYRHIVGYLSLERGILAGLGLSIFGLVFLIIQFHNWQVSGLNGLTKTLGARFMTLFVLALPLGIQTILAVFSREVLLLIPEQGAGKK